MSNDKNHRNARKNRDSRPAGASGADIWLYGYHAVVAALKNKNRAVLRLLTTSETAKELAQERIEARVSPETVSRGEIARFLPEGAVHQGIALLTRPLPALAVEDLDLSESGVIVVLDQVTDPHNVGAILRSAAAFGAKAVITPEKNAPEMTGVLAKSACGAAECVPLIYVSNLVRAMNALKENGWWCVGLDGYANSVMHETDLPEKCVLVMGAEGSGLRRLTAENCDLTVKLRISEKMESLNVSNAAAVALYECSLQRQKRIAK